MVNKNTYWQQIATQNDAVRTIVHDLEYSLSTWMVHSYHLLQEERLPIVRSEFKQVDNIDFFIAAGLAGKLENEYRFEFSGAIDPELPLAAMLGFDRILKQGKIFAYAVYTNVDGTKPIKTYRGNEMPPSLIEHIRRGVCNSNDPLRTLWEEMENTTKLYAQ